MRDVEGSFRGAGGLELHYMNWRPRSEPVAVIVLVHGVGEHCGRYMNMVGPLRESGYSVYGYDQRGHGASPGHSVHIDSWAEYRQDLGLFLEMVAEQVPDRLLILYGHSMGSLVVLDYLLHERSGLAGAIISGVALEPAGVGSPATIAMARVLSGVVPRFYVDLGLDPGSLSRAPEAQEARRTDPLVASRATVRWGTESLKAVERVRNGMSAIEIPLLVLHGGADKLNLPEGAQALYDAASHHRTTLRIYPEVCHEPHNDLGHERVAADITGWLADLTTEGDACV